MTWPALLLRPAGGCEGLLHPSIGKSWMLKDPALGVAGWLVLLLLTPARANDPPNTGGNTTIKARAGRSDIVIITTARLAGAIHSVTWDGKEFIDSFDHGRQLQSASSFDAGS